VAAVDGFRQYGSVVHLEAQHPRVLWNQFAAGRELEVKVGDIDRLWLGERCAEDIGKAEAFAHAPELVGRGSEKRGDEYASISNILAQHGAFQSGSAVRKLSEGRREHGLAAATGPRANRYRSRHRDAAVRVIRKPFVGYCAGQVCPFCAIPHATALFRNWIIKGSWYISAPWARAENNARPLPTQCHQMDG